jgi:hypothetical protein
VSKLEGSHFAQLNSQVNFVITLAFPSSQLHIAILGNIHENQDE